MKKIMKIKKGFWLFGILLLLGTGICSGATEANNLDLLGGNDYSQNNYEQDYSNQENDNGLNVMGLEDNTVSTDDNQNMNSEKSNDEVFVIGAEKEPEATPQEEEEEALEVESIYITNADGTSTEIKPLQQLMTTVSYSDAKVSPADGSSVAFSYVSGTSLYITGVTADGKWYVATFRGTNGYVPKKDLKKKELYISSVNEEMDHLAQKAKITIGDEEVSNAKKDNSKLWIVITIVVILLILVTGLFFLVRSGTFSFNVLIRDIKKKFRKK